MTHWFHPLFCFPKIRIYQVIAEWKILPQGGKCCFYGIRGREYSAGGWKEMTLHNLSAHPQGLCRLARSCTRGQLSLLQLRDVVDDFLLR